MASTNKEIFDSDLSTRVPTPTPASELDHATDVEASSVTKEKDGRIDNEPDTDAATAEETIEYPEGARLIFVIVALVLSIFLVALDMVSPLALAGTTPVSHADRVQ